MQTTKQKFDRVLLKVWFGGVPTSRNFQKVMSMERSGNILTVINDSGPTYLLNWDNINMIEEIYSE